MTSTGIAKESKAAAKNDMAWGIEQRGDRKCSPQTDMAWNDMKWCQLTWKKANLVWKSTKWMRLMRWMSECLVRKAELTKKKIPLKLCCAQKWWSGDLPVVNLGVFETRGYPQIAVLIGRIAQQWCAPVIQKFFSGQSDFHHYLGTESLLMLEAFVVIYYVDRCLVWCFLAGVKKPHEPPQWLDLSSQKRASIKF